MKAHQRVESPEGPLGDTYSRKWFATFLGQIDESIVAREVAFIARQIGQARSVLDLCCGPGRHAAPLAGRGYDVVGLDLDEPALRDALERAPSASFIRGDMRRLPLPHNLDREPRRPHHPPIASTRECHSCSHDRNPVSSSRARSAFSS